MASKVTIANAALHQIGATQITAFTEDSKPARIINDRYDVVRDSVFRAHPWNCLTVRVKISADVATPAFGYAKQFTLPTDPFCLRVIALSNPNIVYQIEGRKLLSDEDEIELKYIGRITDVSTYDTLLSETISAALAHDIAYPLVGSTTLSTVLYEKYLQKLSEARFIDATEDNLINVNSISESHILEANTFISSRF
tara:strand:- start:3167 stop:3757 length:591 start_codon:yes stop_codon:yes gene_type:complete